jgi:hypothetical protein
MAAFPAENDNLPLSGLRLPETVMRLERMGASFPTRLSFMRTLIRDLNRAGAEIDRPVWDINAEGYGRAVYRVKAFGDTASLVAFSTPLAEEDRTDRVIAEAWDTSYVLYDGVPDTSELDRLQTNAPRQEAGRFSERDLVLSRANKSVRLFAHVVDRLAEGRQPDTQMIRQIGYLMRTTAVYGNGKFGIADRARLKGRPLLDGAFRAEMLAVWLIRAFTHDLAEHIAKAKAPDSAVPLAPGIKRHLGIGNATGLGMAPFLVSHPRLLNNWMLARETALARVRALPEASAETRNRLATLTERALTHLDDWSVDDDRQMRRIETLRREFRSLSPQIDKIVATETYPFDRLIALTEPHSFECQELMAALILEPHGGLIDNLTATMIDEADDCIDAAMRLAELRVLVDKNWSFATGTDFTAAAETAQFWYVSEEKLEPRLGRRHEEAGAEREMPLDIARRVHALANALREGPHDESVAEFLLRKPEHRYAVSRVQTQHHHPYSEIRDNLIAGTALPIDMLRAKLSFFGAAKFDPRSTLWTRITLYQGAPLPTEIKTPDADDWWLPIMDGAS